MLHTTLRSHRRADLIRACLLIATVLLLSSPAHGQTTPGGCRLPDPFVAFGGGTCFNGGWLPPGMPVPPSPPPASGGCLTPDPFIALGGGTCFNGGWFPPAAQVSTPTLTPPPPPPPLTLPAGCATPDPFTAFGGGTCVNGGWLPPGASAVPPSLPPPPPAGGCTTPDPFASIPGMTGVCVNGGWQPTGTPTAEIQLTGVVFEMTPDGPMPVSGALVTFADLLGSLNGDDPLSQTMTDANGRFSITVADATQFARSRFREAVYTVSKDGYDHFGAVLDFDFSGSLLATVDVSVELARAGGQ